MFVEAKESFSFFGKKLKQAPQPPAAVTVVSPKPAPSTAPSVEIPALSAGDAQHFTALKDRVVNNNMMTDAEKSELAMAALKHFAADADLRAKEFEPEMLRFEQIANDPNMKAADKKAAIENAFAGPKSGEIQTSAPTHKAQAREAVREEKKIQKSGSNFSSKKSRS